VNRVRGILLLIAFFCGGAVVAEEPPLSDEQDFIFLAPDRPYFIRLHLQVDGDSFRMMPDRLAENLFAALDGDEDGLLSEQEARRIPARDRFRDLQDPAPITFDELDQDGNGSVEPQELTQFVRNNSAKSLKVESQPPQARIDVDLFARMDAGRDGDIVAEEALSTLSRYSKYDIDDDQTLSASELAVLMPQPGETEDADATLLLPLDNSRWQSDVAVKLLKLYGHPPADGKTGRRVSLEELGISPKHFQPLDKNQDGELDLAELTPLVQDPPETLEFLLELKTKGARLTVTPLTKSKRNRVSYEPLRGGRLLIDFSGISVRIENERSRVTARDDSKMFRLRFLQADADKNGYLGEGEFNGLQLPSARFEDVDRNGDEMVDVKEVTRYVEQQSSLARNQIHLKVAKDGQTLFSLLDTNLDRRLSRREFLSAMERIAEWDANGDGRLTLLEIPRNYKLTFSVGQSLLFAADQMGGGPMNLEALRPEEDSSAPVWFQKMDRNRDGDISQREFLGPLEKFTEIDRDGDGLIDPQEAEQAGGQ